MSEERRETDTGSRFLAPVALCDLWSPVRARSRGRSEKGLLSLSPLCGEEKTPWQCGETAKSWKALLKLGKRE